jgi:hypothetical protein
MSRICTIPKSKTCNVSMDVNKQRPSTSFAWLLLRAISKKKSKVM